MTTLTYTFEGGTDEATITTSDTGSGTAWDGVNIPAQGGSPSPATIKYDTAWFANGTTGSRIITTDAGSAFLLWDAAIGTSTEHYTRVYLKRPTSLPATRQFIQMRDTTPTTICSVRFTSAGKVALHDLGGTARYTSTKTFSSGEEFRIEVHVVHSTTNGHMEARLFYGANLHGLTPDETMGSLVTNWNTGAALDHIRYGAMTTAAAGTNETIVMDEIEWNDTGWPGPAAGSGGGGGGGGGGTPGVVDALVEPTTTGYTQLNDPNPAAVWTPTLAAGVNYILKGPGGVTPWARTRRLNVNGGRNVVVRDMTIDIGVDGGPMVDIQAGSSERDVWFIDCELKDTGKFQADGFKSSAGAGGNIATGSGGTNLYLLRVRVTGIIGEQDGVHADGVQWSGGMKSVHEEDCTWSSGWVAHQPQHELFQTGLARTVTALTRVGTIGTVQVTTGLDIAVGDWVEFGDTVTPTTWRSAWPVRSILTGTRPNVTRFTIFLGDGGQAAWDGAAGTTCYKSAFLYYVGDHYLKNVNFRAQSNAPITVPSQTITALRIPAGRPDFKGSNAEDRTPALVEGMDGILVLDNVYVEPNASPPDNTLPSLLEPNDGASVYTPAKGFLDTTPTPDEFSWPDHPAISGVIKQGVPPGGDFAPVAGGSTTTLVTLTQTIPAFSQNVDVAVSVHVTLTQQVPPFTGLITADAGAVTPVVSGTGVRILFRDLPKVGWTIDGNPVQLSGWQPTDNAGGYDQLRGEMTAKSWLALDAAGVQQGSEVIGWGSDGKPIWAGRLSTRPLVKDDVAPIAAQGHKYAVAKKTKRLFIQARGLDGWTTADSEPHLDDSGDPVYGASKLIDVDLSGSRALFVVERNQPIQTPRWHGIVFYAEGVNIARVAWRASYAVADETSNLKFQLQKANGPTGAETDVGGGRATTAVNNKTLREETFSDDPNDLVILALMSTSAFTPSEKGVYRLSGLKVNSDICLLDEFNAYEVLNYIAGQCGLDPSGITASEFQILPFDWTDDWLSGATYLAELEDKAFRIGAGDQPLAEYIDWGTTSWETSQAQGCTLDLRPLESYDRVEVWYPSPSGVKRRAVATGTSGVGNTFTYELQDVQTDNDLATAVAERLLARVEPQRFAGTVHITRADASNGSTDPYGIRYGDTVTVTDFAPGEALTLRVQDVSGDTTGVTAGIEDPVSPAQIIADLRRPA